MAGQAKSRLENGGRGDGGKKGSGRDREGILDGEREGAGFPTTMRPFVARPDR